MRLRAYSPPGAAPEAAQDAPFGAYGAEAPLLLRPAAGEIDTGRLDPLLVVVHQPQDPLAVAARELRAALAGGKGHETPRRLAVLGLSAPRLGPVFSANLAAAFAQAGRRTLLVDCNLGQGAQHRLFGLDGQQGLADLLRGDAPSQRVVRATAVRNLAVLPAGASHRPAAEVLNDKSVRESLEPVTGHFDLTLLDATGGEGALSACLEADGVVVLARQHVTPTAELHRASEWLALHGVPVLSVLLVA